MDRETNSFEYTLGVLTSLDRQARDEIERLGGNQKLTAILDLLKVDDSRREKAA
jgi:geranylgeranyl diphosphate synthase, type III